ncbi:MAG: aminopeptidase [Bacteroidales bacterium]|nr:aminopeptidase [Bacteroidales bacterium]MBR4979938.1 aminopeptidase [Bacteroidales bacterium]MBR5907525.1 aminopeptidase [Bacteroidales bacterium]
MKTIKYLFAAVALICVTAMNVNAQEKAADKRAGYEFTTVKANPISAIRNQGSSGTCWCFSTTSFLESEAIRLGKADTTLKLSTMYSIFYNYMEKMQKFVRLDGYLNNAEGGSFEDVIHTFEDYGVVQEQDMPDLQKGETRINFREMSAITAGLSESMKKNAGKGGKISQKYLDIYKNILETYIGKVPESTTYRGVVYTPKDFVTKGLGLNMDDYVSLTSFTHHPFYTQFAIEVPDNWRWDLSYNIPIDELMAVMFNAIEKGYTVAWGSDVSEVGFTRNGIAVVPDVEANTKAIGSDQERWVGKDPNAKMAEINNLNHPGKEMVITQEMRQEGYDNKTTTDDHGMQIFGIATDQNGTKYFMVKNSWGKTGKYNGIWYASETFVKFKTMNIVVNKNSIPKEIRKKLGI